MYGLERIHAAGKHMHRQDAKEAALRDATKTVSNATKLQT
jgi:hypothetical protein